MRTAFVVCLGVGALAGACAGDSDEGPYRPGGGGGGGGSNQGGDARPVDAPVGDGGALLAGEICVVTDLRDPVACPAVADRAGVPVVVLGTATSATSNANGVFEVQVFGTEVTLDVAAGSATLVRSFVPATVTGVGVDAPAVTQAAFDAVIGSLTTVVPDGGGTVVAYVADGNSPAVGVAFDTIEGSSVAPWYDNGSATSWTQSGGTGAAGVALFVDVPAGSSVTIEGVAADSRVARATVPVAGDTITFVNVALVAQQ